MAINGRVLVVDDEPINLNLIEAILIPLGFEVHKAGHGEDCLDMARRLDPDVVLLDIMMPIMDGYEVARRLKAEEQTSIIPIVMVTALNDVSDRVRALEAGADDFLTKPVERTELLARVRSLVKVKSFHKRQQDHQKILELDIAEKSRELDHAFQQLRHAALDTIYRLGRAAEFKDEQTGAHVHRISHLSALVAKNLGLDKELVKAIFYAAPLHDVGKIGTPDKILLKPGKLSPAEWEVMKEHTVIGARILEDSMAEYIQLARTIALAHHERWDGTGYPFGLKGNQIPLEARIVAVADVFDALRSKRPYKDTFSFSKSISIIKQSKGTYFSPEIVDIFLALEDEIFAIDEKYRKSGSAGQWGRYEFNTDPM